MIRRLILMGSIVGALASCTSTSRVVRVFPNGLPRVPHRPATGFVKSTVCGSGNFLFIRLSQTPSVVQAIEKALESAEGNFNGLADVTASFERTSWFLFGYNCVTVRGRPVYVGVEQMPPWMVPATSTPAGTAEEDWVF